MNAKTRSNKDAGLNENPAVANLEAWARLNKPMIDAMSDFNGRIIRQVSQANNEWLAFLNRRINEDLAASQRLMECKSLPELFAAYAEFVQRAQAHYQSEFQHFARLNQNFAEETATAMKAHLDGEANRAESTIRH